MPARQDGWGVALITLVATLSGCGRETSPPLRLAPQTQSALARRPVELTLADGRLQVFNLYKLQASILADTAPLTRDERIDQLVQSVYQPHAAFWNGYLGDESDFRHWARDLFNAGHPLSTSLPALARVNLDSLFEVTAAWLRGATGLDPAGRWYLVYGPGWTNMGGLGTLGMVADFSKQTIEGTDLASVLSHELAHQVHGVRTPDPDSGTVLERIVSEGVASYANFVFEGDQASPARSLGYSDAEFAWAVAHERELQAAVTAILSSRERANLDRVAASNQALVRGGPGKAGYFLGFRIAAAYVARHGSNRWADLLRLPVREVARASGYGLPVDG